MKFNLNHDPANKTLSIPRAVLQFSGLAGVSGLTIHADDGCVLLMPKDASVAEMVKTVQLLNEINIVLIAQLVSVSHHAMEEIESKCLGCPHEDDCFGICIPPCQLTEAGIDPDSELECSAQDGTLTVTAIEKTDADTLVEEMDDGLRQMLANCGVLMAGLRRLLEQEGYHDE